jgi:hypothetical protein
MKRPTLGHRVLVTMDGVLHATRVTQTLAQIARLASGQNSRKAMSPVMLPPLMRDQLGERIYVRLHEHHHSHKACGRAAVPRVGASAQRVWFESEFLFCLGERRPLSTSFIFPKIF